MENWIKITFNEEGVGAFRIHYENGLGAEYERYFDDVQVEDVVVTMNTIEPAHVLAAMQNAVEFLTVNAYEMSEHIAESYVLEEEDKNDTLLI